MSSPELLPPAAEPEAPAAPPRRLVDGFLDGVGLVLAVIIGLGSGGVLTVIHREAAPWGLLLGLLLVAALVVGYRLAFGGRRQAIAAALGAAVAVLVLSAAGPGGSVLIHAEPLGYAWSFGMPVVAAAALILPWRRRAAAPPE